MQLAEPGDAAVPAALPGQFLVMRLPVNPQVLAMLHALAAAKSGRDIWWLHGARNRAEEPFAAESPSLLTTLASGRQYSACAEA